MNEEEFWQLIEVAHEQSSGDMDSKCERVKLATNRLSPEEATAFAGIFDEMMDKSYTWPLWGAAYVMSGGCSDDAFTDFRSSLISRGKQGFDQAIANPDSLASEQFDEDVWYFEGFQYAISESVEAVVGSIPQRSTPRPDEPSGEPWDEDPEELKAKYPDLWLAFAHVWTAPTPRPSTPKTKPWWKFW